MIDPGSFRDPDSRVFHLDGRVFRGLTARAAQVYDGASALRGDLEAAGLFVESWKVEDAAPPEGVPGDVVVESRRLPVISYPSEWSFGMLQDAALATVDANRMAIDHGFILKDASAFNVAFDGARPLILDVASLEPFGEKGMWGAYGQFCDHFLSPLMAEAYVGLAAGDLLRGRIAGFPVGELDVLATGRTVLRKGVPSHVKLRAALERRADSMSAGSRRTVGKAELPRAAVARSLDKMRELVAGLTSQRPSRWSGYEEATPYATEEAEAKSAFVARAAAESRGHDMALDVGANEGRYTRALAGHFGTVVAIDNDAGVVDAMYRSARADGFDVVSLVVDVTNPTPAFGWRGRERPAFVDRVRPDFATWLAVVHHLALTGGIPLDQLAALVVDLSEEAVVEFVSPEDPMVRRIAATRTSDAPYSQEAFESALRTRAAILATEPVTPHRTLYHVARTAS